MKNDISQSLGLDLDKINVYAEVYQYIPLSSRDKAIFTFSRILALGKASTDDKCHFTIVSLFSEFEPRQKLNQSQMSLDNLMGTSCQYQCVCKIPSQYSTQFKMAAVYGRAFKQSRLLEGLLVRTKFSKY